MKEMKISDIVDKLIGSTSVWCETNHDDESYDNMKEVEQLIYHLVSKVVENYEYKDRQEYSAQTLSKQAKSILDELRCILDGIS